MEWISIRKYQNDETPSIVHSFYDSAWGVTLICNAVDLRNDFLLQETLQKCNKKGVLQRVTFFVTFFCNARLKSRISFRKLHKNTITCNHFSQKTRISFWKLHKWLQKRLQKKKKCNRSPNYSDYMTPCNRSKITQTITSHGTVTAPFHIHIQYSLYQFFNQIYILFNFSNKNEKS